MHRAGGRMDRWPPWLLYYNSANNNNNNDNNIIITEAQARRPQ